MEIWETIIMKLTKTKLQEIIQEELEKVVKEYGAPVFSPKKEKSQYARKMPVADEDDRTELEKAVSKDKRLEEKDDNWIQDAEKDIEKRGTEGVCTGDKFGSDSCPEGSKRYNLAKTFRKMAKDKKKD